MERSHSKKPSYPPYQVNPTYHQDNDSDSHHYIEPMAWINDDTPHHFTGDVEHSDTSLESSPQVRKRIKANPVSKNIRDELPSRNFDTAEPSDDESESAGPSVKRSNSNLTMLRFRNIASRQMDGNTLFELLSKDSEATNEQVCETLRHVNQSLTLKRQVKARLSQQEAEKEQRTVSFKKRIKYNLAMNWQHLHQYFRTILQSMDLWHSHLKAVQGHFGSGVASYFFFLRRLFFLNLLGCFLILCFIVVPQAIWNRKNSKGSGIQFTGAELVTGGESFTDTVMFYGSYTNESIGVYKIPEAYLFTNIAFIVSCIVILTYSVAKSYRVNHIEVAGELKNVFANKVFSAWDYSIEREAAARLKSKSIFNELMELISEEINDQGPLSMSRKLYLFFWRALINLLILTAMAGTGFLVHYLLTQHYAEQVEIPVLKEITVALVVTGILFFIPFLFSLMSNQENYSLKETQLYLNVVRVVLLRAVILGVVVVYWLNENERANEISTTNEPNNATVIGPSIGTTQATLTSTTKQTSNSSGGLNTATQICWETKLGQETYRLIIVDFLCILLLPTLIMEMLRRLVYDHCCKSVGFPEFDIAQNTLDLVYTQMLIWIGFFYSPMLPFIALIKLVIIFYVKRLSVIRNCRPSEKAWRAAHAQTIFLTLTFLSFLLSLCVLGYSILQIRPSSVCGPFRDLETVYKVVLKMMGSLNDSTEIIKYFFSPGIVAGFLLFMCVVLYYKRATARGHREMVKLLREQLTLEGKDKVFLLRLFENAMTQQQICTYMRKASNVGQEPDRKDSMKYGQNIANHSGNTAFPFPEPQTNRPIINNNIDLSNEDFGWKQSRENDAHQRNFEQNPKPREGPPYMTHGANNFTKNPVLDRRDSRPRENSPFTGQGSVHRFNARDKSPFVGRGVDSPREGSPFYGPSLRGPSASPQGTWDRRSSQGHPVPQAPLFMKPTHQHGFRQLTPGSHNPSRQTTPQRF